MSNNNRSNVSNLTNNEGIYASMDMQEKMEKKFNEKFVNDYKTMEIIGTVIEAFKHAFYEFFQNFIDPEKLQVISNTFNGNNIDVIAFLYENINKLESKYKTNNPAFTNLSLEEQKYIDDYINALSKDAVNSLMTMVMRRNHGGKGRKKRKGKTRKQRKTKRNKAKSKAKSKRRRTKRN